MNQLKLPDLYTFRLLKLYYKLYRNKLSSYFDNFIPQYGAYHQNLRNNYIRVYSRLDVSLKKIILDIKCTSDCASWLLHPTHLSIPNIDISDDILSQSLSCLAKYVKSKYMS